VIVSQNSKDTLHTCNPVRAVVRGLYQNGTKPKRPRPKRPTNFWHVQNGPHRCPKWPNAATKRPRPKTAHSWIRSVSCSACS